MFDNELKRMNPQVAKLTYKVNDIYVYIDSFAEFNMLMWVVWGNKSCIVWISKTASTCLTEDPWSRTRSSSTSTTSLARTSTKPLDFLWIVCLEETEQYTVRIEVNSSWLPFDMCETSFRSRTSTWPPSTLPLIYCNCLRDWSTSGSQVMGKIVPKRRCCMTGNFPRTSRAQYRWRCVLTFLQEGLRLMSNRRGLWASKIPTLV